MPRYAGTSTRRTSCARIRGDRQETRKEKCTLETRTWMLRLVRGQRGPLRMCVALCVCVRPCTHGWPAAVDRWPRASLLIACALIGWCAWCPPSSLSYSDASAYFGRGRRGHPSRSRPRAGQKGANRDDGNVSGFREHGPKMTALFPNGSRFSFNGTDIDQPNTVGTIGR